MKEKDLIKFEDDIANLFNQGKIRSPIHLYSGNEKILINLCKHIKEDYWVF